MKRECSIPDCPTCEVYGFHELYLQTSNKYAKAMIEKIKLRAENSELKKQKDEIIKYCSPHLDTMWAATIVGILLNCDFRDSKEALAKIKET